METYQIRIRNLREDADMTQAQIAAYLGTKQTIYSRYERGEDRLPINHLIALAALHHVSADYILGLPEGLPYGKSKTKKSKTGERKHD